MKRNPSPFSVIALEAYFERQGYLNMARAGAIPKKRRFERLSDRDEVPTGSAHNRTMKKVGTPDEQTGLGDFSTEECKPWWKRIRDELLPPFHTGVEQILDEIAGSDRDGIREPVHAAIDITPWEIWVSPFKSEDDADPGEEPVEYEDRQGREKEKYLKEWYRRRHLD